MSLLHRFLATGALVPPANYIEDVFSTWLYTGNGSTQTITNGIDLAGKGGLVWLKSRANPTSHNLWDTANGVGKYLQTNSSIATDTSVAGVTSFLSNGFNVDGSLSIAGGSGGYVSWTFRKAPKFFDVVTYTGTGSTRTVAHSLGVAPGMLIVKRTDVAADWIVYHVSTGNAQRLLLNLTSAAGASGFWGSTSPTASVFTVAGANAEVNASGATYVAYLFAHNAGGFGPVGTDNVISCGSFTTSVGTKKASVNLGYEPQFVLVKQSATVGDWLIADAMRGMPVGVGSVTLSPNLSGAEVPSGSSSIAVSPQATGFEFQSVNSETFIYIAIRRGPMKVPTSGASVFGLTARTGTGANATVTGSAGVSDAALVKNRGSAVASLFSSRLTSNGYLVTSTAAAEVAAGTTILQANPWDEMDGIKVGSTSTITNANANTFINYLFDRAPSVHDQVCFTGTGANTTKAHNLTKAPELWLVKSRSAATEWVFGSSLLNANEKIVMPSPNGRVTDATAWNSTYPTSSIFSLGTATTTNASAATFVAYLWATTSGVSKVGTYTGNGGSQTINCGFTTGARFVMIIRATASTSQDIYIWDSARGIVAGNDPRLSLNTSAAEVTTLDSVDADTTGFIVNTDASNVNVNGAVYLYLSYA